MFLLGIIYAQLMIRLCHYDHSEFLSLKGRSTRLTVLLQVGVACDDAETGREAFGRSEICQSTTVLVYAQVHPGGSRQRGSAWSDWSWCGHETQVHIIAVVRATCENAEGGRSLLSKVSPSRGRASQNEGWLRQSPYARPTRTWFINPGPLAILWQFRFPLCNRDHVL